MRALLLLLLLAVVLVTVASAARRRPKNGRCPPGFHVGVNKRGRRVCRRCPPGSFLDRPSRFRRCMQHRQCKTGEDVLVPGTRRSNTVCRCTVGARHYYNVDDLYGYDCMTCPQGHVVQMVLNGFDYGDTACCPHTCYALRIKSGEIRCRTYFRYLVPSSSRR